ncbi:MAG TPA: hypothetical protein DEB06_04115 [Phycisphaerales bacterium]|nr:hypothetical protein [Phycisphaerales bacterium]
MRVLLDGTELTGAGTTLGSAIAAVRRAAGDRFVIEATADGAAIVAEHFATPPERDPYAAEVHFRTADPASLVRETLAEAADRVSALRAIQSEAARAVHAGRLGETLRDIGVVLEGWSTVRRALELALASGLVNAPQPGSGEDVESVVQGLVERLSELKRAIGVQDWSGLGDVLAYDLDEEAGRWSKWLVEMSRTIP